MFARHPGDQKKYIFILVLLVKCYLVSFVMKRDTWVNLCGLNGEQAAINNSRIRANTDPCDIAVCSESSTTNLLKGLKGGLIKINSASCSHII